MGRRVKLRNLINGIKQVYTLLFFFNPILHQAAAHDPCPCPRAMHGAKRGNGDTVLRGRTVVAVTAVP